MLPGSSLGTALVHFFPFIKLYSPPGACTWKIALKYKVKQSKNDKFTSSYKACPIDFETQISPRG